METSAVKVSYWAVQEGVELLEPDGIEEFKEELSAAYSSRVHGRPGDLGGGLYELTIEFVANTTIHEVLNFLAEGIAFDLLKSGTNAFVLKPLLVAYEKLRNRNRGNGSQNVDIYQLTFVFNDAEVVIDKINEQSIYDSVGEIFRALAENYSSLQNSDGEFPYTIHIPVFEDPDKKLCRFRVLLDVDEKIENVTAADYLGFWGIYYDYERKSRVFDVQRRLLIDSDFLTLDHYWEEWERARRDGRLDE